MKTNTHQNKSNLFSKFYSQLFTIYAKYIETVLEHEDIVYVIVCAQGGLSKFTLKQQQQ